MHSVYHAIPTSYEQAREMTRGKPERNIGYCTSVTRACDGDDVYLIHHGTWIVSFHVDGSVTVNTGGWHTSTTKARINAVLRGSPWCLTAERNEWWWFRNSERLYEFRDGDRIYPNAHARGAEMLAAIFEECK